jgi:hypothetical protein
VVDFLLRKETEIHNLHVQWGAEVAQSVQWLTTDWTTGIRSPTEVEDFPSSLCVRTGSGSHSASCPMGTAVLSPGVKRGRGVTLTTHPYPVPRLSMSMSYTSSPPCTSMACSWTALLLHVRYCKVIIPSIQNYSSEDNSFLLYCAMKSRRTWPTFQRYLLPPSSGRRSTSTRLQSAISQKAVIFILAAIRT